MSQDDPPRPLVDASSAEDPTSSDFPSEVDGPSEGSRADERGDVRARSEKASAEKASAEEASTDLAPSDPGDGDDERDGEPEGHSGGDLDEEAAPKLLDDLLEEVVSADALSDSDRAAAEGLDDLLDLLSERDVNELLDRHEPNSLSGGDTIGNYELVRRIGGGAMGEVWEAKQENLGRHVALKILRQDAASRRSRQLFEREARAMARLNQTHIVTVHDTGHTDGRMWISQELVVGRRTFATVLDEQRAERDAGEEPPADLDRRTVMFFLHLARAVAYAHSQGVLHRDLKPANVLVTETGDPKIADFGLALLREMIEAGGERGLTGTPSYMSPEQVAGQVYGLDERTDIFSLGVMLYEALCLERPFESDADDVEIQRREVMEKIVTAEIDAPSDHRRRVPSKLQAICNRCLEKDRSLRYGSAHDLALDLERFLDNRPLQEPRERRERDDGNGTDEAYNPLSGHPGQFLENFRLVRFLDRGRQGEVWEAFDTRLSQPVALKLVVVEGRSQAQVDRFELEAKATARCEHPGIVRALQCGETHGVLWIAMELIPGAHTLRQAIEEEFGAAEVTIEDQEPSTPASSAEQFREKARFMAHLADALAEVHGKNVIHRDVKPSNILIGADGLPRIGDFGTARVLDLAGPTQVDERVGTPRYMSPEQMNPDLCELDGRSDVFALGICLFEFLSGVHPFKADSTPAVQHKILHERSLNLARLVTRLPHDLETICSTALAKRPDERYASMADLAADLHAFEQGRPIAARAPGRTRQVSRWMRRNVVPVVSAAAVLISVGVTIFYAREAAAGVERRVESSMGGVRTLHDEALAASARALASGSSEGYADVLMALGGLSAELRQLEQITAGLRLTPSLDDELETLLRDVEGSSERVDDRLGDGTELESAWARIGATRLEGEDTFGPWALPLGLVQVDPRGEEPTVLAHVSTGCVARFDGEQRADEMPALEFVLVAGADATEGDWWVARANPTESQWSRVSDAESDSDGGEYARQNLGWVTAPPAVVARVAAVDPGEPTEPGPRPALRAVRR